MKKLISVILFGSALVLSACGGESESSGGGGSEPLQFKHLSVCDSTDNTIYVQEFGLGCKFKTPKLNKGMYFSLSCRDMSRFNNMSDTFEVQAPENGDIDSVIQDIETFQKFRYVCRSSSYNPNSSGY